MDARTAKTQRMLMLSDCIPDPIGTVAQSRAWQLLRLAGQSHQIRLACQVNQPINLYHWRAVSAQVEHLVMETGTLRHRAVEAAVSLFSKKASAAVRARTPITSTKNAGLTNCHYDLVLCTNPALWPHVRDVPAEMKACDIAQNTARSKYIGQVMRGLQWDNANRAQWDVVITDKTYPLKFTDRIRGRYATVPRTVDADYLASSLYDQARTKIQGHEPLLVLHADWNRPKSSAFATWFTRAVWPGIQKAVGKCQLLTTKSPTVADPVNTLCGASLVVVSSFDSGIHGRSALLQAMAAQRPTVACSRTIATTGAEDHLNVVSANHEREWIHNCSKILVDEHLQLRLSQGAAAFIEQRTQEDNKSTSLLDLFGSHHDQVTLALAA